MIVKTFTAPNLRDALRNVRDAFGEDAVILDTKFEPSAIGRTGSRLQQVHVTAAFEPDMSTPEELEGPHTLRLKGGLANAESESVPTNGDAMESRGQSRVQPDVAQSLVAQLPQLAALLGLPFTQGTGPQPHQLLNWLATKSKLAGEVIEAFSTDLAESLPPYGPFLEREHSPLRVLFVGGRGTGKSNALFKTYATRWRQKQTAPGLLVVSDVSAHRHERLAAVCQSCGVPFLAHALPDGRLSLPRDLRRRDLFIEFSESHSQSDLARGAKKVVRAANPDVVVLVISAAETDAQWVRAVERFAPFNPTHLVVTHWDDDQPWWRLAAFARRFELSLAYRICGTDLFDEIDPFTEVDLRTGLIAESTASLIPPGPVATEQGRGR